jgi:alpha-L-rhamnosidase
MTNNIHSEQKQATWIWYPGDFEVWLGNKMNNRRTARGAFFPPFWKQDSHFVTVEFSKRFTLETSETITIMAEGKFNIKLDGEMAFGMPSSFHIPAGTHSLNIKVWNQETPPALFVDGPTLKSDSTWQVTNEDKEWIDDSGKASDTSASVYMDAGSWNFNSPARKPSLFQLKRTPIKAVNKENAGGGTLYDFGRETFGYLVFHGVDGEGIIHVYYGESREEAQDKENCELLDKFSVHNGQICDLSINECCNEHGVTPNNKAFRYVFVTIEGGVTIGDVSMEYEYLPEESRGTFRCDDEEVNRMWAVGEYTLQLTAREFFIDGIKRDRWTWSGDAYQSYLMNYYLFFDSESVKRTTWQLRGKDPVTGHINTIMDYTFYWFMGIYDYYLYTGDRHFVSQIYPRMQTMMDYVLGRLDDNGMLQGLSGDWVFVDWSPKPMSKQGELAFEQILFCKSLETMALCATLVDEADDASKYQSLAETLKAKLIPTFWDEEKRALVHSVVKGLKGADVERYANMFAIFFGYLTEEQKRDVAEHVLHNDDVMPITTPYMRFYEMEALCQLGEQAEVMRQMKEYWGGMLRLGATSFWEAYDPSIPLENGIAPHLAMYGRPYGKSLCHAWGASPIYLLGKYFIGVRPVEPGYAKYEVRPVLGGLKWMEGTVPTPHGCIRVCMDEHAVTVNSDAGEGTLYIADKVVSIPAGQEITVEY